MRVLVACEYSGTVRDAFLRKGHDAISCDLLPSDSPDGEHYQGDVCHLLNDKWDLIIAHPPCTYLSNSGVRWLYNNGRMIPKRWDNLEDAMLFFRIFVNHPCKKKIVPKEKRTQDIWLASPGPERWKLRSKTFLGIADAMANQWG
jgi:hypothetical protein